MEKSFYIKFAIVIFISIAIGFCIGFFIRSGEIDTIRTKLNETIELHKQLGDITERLGTTIDGLPEFITGLQDEIGNLSEENNNLIESNQRYIESAMESQERFRTSLSELNRLAEEIRRENKTALEIVGELKD